MLKFRPSCIVVYFFVRCRLVKFRAGLPWMVVHFWCMWVCEIPVEPRVSRACGRFRWTAAANWASCHTPRPPTSPARHFARGLQALLPAAPETFPGGPGNVSRWPQKLFPGALENLPGPPQKKCPPGRIVGNPRYKMCPFCPKSCVPEGPKSAPKLLPAAPETFPGGPRNFSRGA